MLLKQLRGITNIQKYDLISFEGIQFSGCKKLFPLKIVISAKQFRETSVPKMKMCESILHLAQLSKQKLKRANL